MSSLIVAADAALVYRLQQIALSLSPNAPSLAASCSLLGDPRYVYLALFPLVFWSLGPRAGGHTLAAAAVAEWLNIVLKW